MFGALFGWRKASRCKKLIRRVQCRLKILRHKRDSIIRQLREDVAQLLKNGQGQSAFARVEQLSRDQSITAAYNLLDHFCEFIIIHLPYIRRHRDRPNDINEAVSSLLFASARCGDLPELHKLRKLFAKRYGHKFAMAAIELFPGNNVNHQIVEKLCMKSIPDNVKLRLIKEIAKDDSLQLGPPVIDGKFKLQHQQVYDLYFGDCNLEWEEQFSEKDIQVNFNSTGQPQLQASNDKEMKWNATPYGLSSDCKELVTNASESFSNLGIMSNSIDPAVVIQTAPYIVQPHSSTFIHKSTVKVENHEKLDLLCEPGLMLDRSSGQSNPGSHSSSKFSIASVQHKVERISGTGLESSSHFPEKIIVYLDDIEEFQTIQEDGKDKDQRLFLFKAAIWPLRDNCGASRASLSGLCYDGYTKDHTEPCKPLDGKTSSRSTSKRRKSSRRYGSLENQMYHSSTSLILSMKDVECALYYGEPGDYSLNENLLIRSSLHRRKNQRKMSAEEGRSSSITSRRKKLSSPQQLYSAWKTPEELCCEEMGENCQSHKCKYNQRRPNSSRNLNHDMAGDCCLEHPCYFFIWDSKDDWGSPSPRRSRGTTTLVDFPYRNLQRGECEDHRRRKGHPSKEAFNSSTLTTNNCRRATDKATSNNMRDEERGWVSPHRKSRLRRHYRNSDVVPVMASRKNKHNEQILQPKTQTLPPYLRAMTMPPERPKGTPTEQIPPSISCQFKQPNHLNGSSSSSCPHVHPKLPDYDDLAAKFMALKKEYLQSSTAQVSNGF